MGLGPDWDVRESAECQCGSVLPTNSKVKDRIGGGAPVGRWPVVIPDTADIRRGRAGTLDAGAVGGES